MFHAARTALLALPVLALGLVPGAPALAQAQAPAVSVDQLKALRTACEADVKKLCAGIQPGGGRIVQCLKDHRQEVSPPCQASIGALVASQRTKQ
ncbi:cysteine rich repeat-containing protein [Xanthobacter autotrophicus DSM 431]|uniref:cysteine rich repeat-containing protein n=1 Tax=Xanthobacter nonsaccharivorans TaxID=3119912 RepID=UPI003728A283